VGSVGPFSFSTKINVLIYKHFKIEVDLDKKFWKQIMNPLSFTRLDLYEETSGYYKLGPTNSANTVYIVYNF